MAIRTLSAKNATIRNEGARRLVIGPPPKSQRAQETGRHASSTVQIIGTPRDQSEKVEADKRLKNTVEVSPELLKSEAMQAAMQACDVRVVS